MKYNGTTYYYITNIQGDVLKIVNSSGTAMATYTYNAWGELLSSSGSLAAINPIRYRSYYYDAETGFYYLQSRYYDPVICRFINADNVTLLGANGDLQSYNLFAYCENNPVNLADDGGNWPRSITATVAVVAETAGVIAMMISMPSAGIVALSVAEIASYAYKKQSSHFDDRKALNGDVPQTRQAAIDQGWYGPGTKPYMPNADCHQYSSKDRSNVKYVSPDGHREAIYNSSGNLVTDSRDIGTYNYSPPGTIGGSVNHFRKDMLPWYIFGNDDNDPGPLINEIVRLFQ